MMRRARQRGVALVTAILMVAIATALATKMAWDNQVNMRRTESNLNIDQARELALGAEAVASSILVEQGTDFGNNLLDIQEPIVYEAGIEDIPLGTVQGQLFDMQGRMNINSLFSNGEVNEPVKEQFRRLFDNIRSSQPDLDLGPALVDTIIDWIDPDTVPYGAGAEDGSYTSLDPGYRTANNYLVDISELRSIGGITPEVYAALLPHVIAVPPGWCGESKVNLNFATAQVIAALTEMAPGTAEQMVQERNEVPWDTLDDIGLTQEQQEASAGLIDTRTNCFALSVYVNVGRSTLTMYSLLDRTGSADQVVSRVRAYGLEN